jgi:RNA polymerase sigma-70 factor (ECF subfamily)
MGGGDEQLMLAYRAGDAGAFEELYRRHRGGLFRFVTRSVRDRAVAEELYQEIWMRAIEARGRYEPQAKFTTWLFSIAHNRLVDHWRKKGLQVVSSDNDDEFPASPASDPQGIAEAKQGLERFARALEALPPAQREAFLLHHEAELSVAEIARATGANEEAAKSRLRYAIAKLKEALGND